MDSFIELNFKGNALEKRGLPNINYWLPKEVLTSGLMENDVIPYELILYGLQLKISDNKCDYKKYCDALLPILRKCHSSKLKLAEEQLFSGNNWTLKLGEIDLTSDEIVTIQRKDELIAAIKKEDNHLVISVYRPLDDGVLSYIRIMAQDIDIYDGQLSGTDKFERAVYLSNKITHSYKADAGESYLSYWRLGLGVTADKAIAGIWRSQTNLQAMSNSDVGIQFYVNEFFNASDFNFGGYCSTMNNQTKLKGIKKKNLIEEAYRLKFLGCLLGGAIGDAFGAPVEFMKREAILFKYGKYGIQDFDMAYGKLGAITDDTQMTLFTTEGLIRSWVRGCSKGVTSELGCIGHAYQRWFQTQGYQSPHNVHVETNGYLWEQGGLHAQRAPGDTCLSALDEMKSFESPAINNSKGCGGVMRVAPIGLYCWRLKNERTVEDCFELASDASNLTHGHVTGCLASGTFAAIIYQVLDGNSLIDACNVVIKLLKSKSFHDETVLKLERAILLSKDIISTHEAIADLGEGWIAEEALAISIYCVLKVKSFKELMSVSVSHDGDSDSTGAIAGNLWGALYGLEECPKAWINKVEFEQQITEIASDLYNFPTWDIGQHSSNIELNELVWQRYPGS